MIDEGLRMGGVMADGAITTTAERIDIRSNEGERRLGLYPREVSYTVKPNKEEGL